MARGPQDAEQAELDEIEALEKAGLDAQDEALRLLRAGRYADSIQDRPSTAKRILGEGLRPVRYRRHFQGWSCRRCGADSKTLTFLKRHDRFHSWLDRLFAWIGQDLDQQAGEIEAVREERAEDRAEMERRCAAAEARADRAQAQVTQIMTLLGPILAKAYPVADQAEATVTVEDRNARAQEPVTAAD
jgi:hypothetical protein